ncbi:MAG: hypothetical protein ACI9U2_005167 [Bradymonadia bacterium]|jgi:hypothetical protein
MSRPSNLSLSLGLGLAAGLVACDDAAVRDLEPEPEPADLVCSEIVLENGRGAIARCPDGAHFSWIVDGREVLTRVSSALVIGGVQLEGDAWPTVTWSFARDADEAAKLGIVYRGRSDLAEIGTFITLQSDALTIETTVSVESPLFLDAVVPVTAGVDPRGKALGLDGFGPTAEVPARLGAQVWLTPLVLSAHASRPAQIGGDGRVEVPISAEASPSADFYLDVHWTIDRLGDGFRGGTLQQGGNETVWGWRTGAAHGAVVDTEAIAAERQVLLSVGEEPWILVDGLWAPALGDWRIEPALRTATDGAHLGLFWPATLVCPDAPVFEETARERLPGDAVCARLNPLIPAARVRVINAATALEAQGVDDLWLATDAFVDLVDLHPIRAFEESRNTSVDRILGAPGADCLQQALNGPFPRSPACQSILRALDAPVDAPQVAPVDGARTLMAHLDLSGVSPLPLTLTGPSGEARQRIVLTALGGGPMLIADAPSMVPLDAWGWMLAVRQRPDAFLAAPRLAVNEWPPSTWDSDTARVLFNFTDAPRTVALESDWIGTRDLFDSQIEATVEVSIPAHDVRVFVRPSR